MLQTVVKRRFFFSGIVCLVVIVEFLSDIVFFIVWLVHNK